MTVIVVSGIKGGAPAWITVVPGLTPLIRTAFVATELPSGKKPTVCCKSATPGLSELNVAKNPAGGAAVDRRRKTICVEPAGSIRFGGENVSVAPTGTTLVAVAYPGAEAVMVADPILIPLSWGWDAGAVEPPGIKMLAGETLTRDELLLVNVTVTPPAGAAVLNDTGNAAV